MRSVFLCFFSLLLFPPFNPAQGTFQKDLSPEARAVVSTTAGRFRLRGLQDQVEVLRDRWGVPHIYAQNQHDLFFAQGYVAAQDRLFQMELWKRSGQGRLAEVVGRSAVETDRFARLLRYRGDMAAEYSSYAPDTLEILQAFTDGINAYITQAVGPLGKGLPVEFKLAGFTPEPWAPEDCLSRMAAFSMTGNAFDELRNAELISRVGPEKTALFLGLASQGLASPALGFNGKLDPAPNLDLSNLSAEILKNLVGSDRRIPFWPQSSPAESNNWTISGKLTTTGRPLLANDPHRTIALPSLRYITHLVAPGWNVIGAGEPALPGVSLGHNQHIAWGFTIFPVDQQDLYIEELNPQDRDLYKTEKGWERVKAEDATIRIKGSQPVTYKLKFTRHGPILWESAIRNRAIALRWTGSEPGTAGYLASLSLDRATNWQEFLVALERWKLPPENLVYADATGNIGEQSAGLTPIRSWTGLLPVPGAAVGLGGVDSSTKAAEGMHSTLTGRTLNARSPEARRPEARTPDPSTADPRNAELPSYEWSGFIPLEQLPRKFNPVEGFFATANDKTIPENFPYPVGFNWSQVRIRRVNEILSSYRDGGHKISREDMGALQNDVVSIPGRELAKLLAEMPPLHGDAAIAQKMLGSWDGRLRTDSAAGALFEVLTANLRPVVPQRIAPGLAARWAKELPTSVLFDYLLARLEAGKKNNQNAAARDLLETPLQSAVAALRQLQGSDPARWSWGAMHKVRFRHSLDQLPGGRILFDLTPVPRPGDGSTVNSTGYSSSGWDQTSGASYREILDCADWDRSLAINVPGESGQPESPHYDDLLPLWSKGEYFPLLFSREKIESAAGERLTLEPENKP